ncbi:MAG TPA: hypothetical protein VFS30_17765 [Dehalococcoidia bacterium]|nr:hypothetical protein [Dehalococcoidia bacterium]
MSASAEIFIEAQEPKARFDYLLTLRDAEGQVLVGKDVVITCEGDGSLQYSHNAKQLVRETNAEGQVKFQWFRRGIFGRDVKAVVTVEGRDLPDSVVTLEPTDPEYSTTSFRTRVYPMKVPHRPV